MIRFLKRRQASFALLLWFTLVFLIAYLSPGRTIDKSLKPALTKRSLNSSKTHPATPAQPNLTAADSDGDGIPDVAEFTAYVDRESFRRWFTGIAEMQFYQLSDQWNPQQRDCAGLVRFAWREALRRHEHEWFMKMGPAYEAMAPDTSSRSLENPLGEKLFRTDFGSYKESDVAGGKFSEFADARTIKTFNCMFISRNRQEAQPGDLLFFFQPWVQKFPYHVLIFLGEPRIAPNGTGDWVVYHTGSSPMDQGTVKKVELSVLEHHPDPRWRPVQGNRNFLGFYRLKILD